MSAAGPRRSVSLLEAQAWRNAAVICARGAVVMVAGLGAAASLATADIPLAERRSTYEQMSPETKAMQNDDTANPGMLWVLDGEALWRAKVGQAARACADCHGEAPQSMKGVAARHPAYDDKHGTAVNLEGRINICRVEQQQAPALAFESKDLLALAAYIARQSRGLPIESNDERLKPFIEAGGAIFERRQGQLHLACAQCHNDNWGKKLAGITMPQGHPTGYPLYRLEWQTLGSLQRRLRNCMIGMRAESYAYGSPEFIALETFLMWRARGMAMESPAVRP
jgi:L-cysteine S-thiosulfotransferase